MRTTHRIAVLCASVLLAACGQGESSRATTSTTTTTTTTAPGSMTETKVETKVEEKPHAPESHGMPGMADLFKGDEKKEEKKDEKADAKK